MKYGMNIPPFGDFGDPRALAELAKEAEKAGWDGFFIWDHIMFDPSFHRIVDPWVGLAAVAMSTTHIRFGTLITPVARRRPWKLARETASLDQLSNGRLTLGVGLGDPVQWDYGFFGEQTDPKVRAKKLDEGLDVLTGLWTGKPFSYSGEQYQLKEVKFVPPPVQQPRIPIWVGGWWPNKPPMRRAARWDGFIPGKNDGGMTLDDWRTALAYIRQHRTSDAPFDVVHSGATPGDDPTRDADLVAPYAELGVTWWIETIDPWRFGANWEAQWSGEYTKRMQERVRQGPPNFR